jgi:hypothetical protein
MVEYTIILGVNLSYIDDVDFLLRQTITVHDQAGGV